MTQNLADIIKVVLAPDPEEQARPHDDATQDQLEAGRGLDPKDMTPEERRLHRNRLQRRRARAYRKGQEAKAEAERKERGTEFEEGEVRDALEITAHLSRLIDDISARRARKAARLIGTRAEDACFETFSAVNRSIAGAIKREEYERGQLLEAAEYLSHQPGIPNVRHDDEAPDGSKWLLSVIEFRSRSAIQSWYEHEPSIESIERLDTTMAATGNDDFFDRFQADTQPAILGARWPQPGQVDHGMVQMVIAGAITERGLDAFVELVLANLRSDGSFSWKAHAEDVFRTLGLDSHWQILCARVASEDLRGRYARGAARRAIAFVLPAMQQAVKMMEQGAWVPPDPERMHLAEQTLVPEPEAQAKVIIEALEAVAEALA